MTRLPSSPTVIAEMEPSSGWYHPVFRPGARILICAREELTVTPSAVLVRAPDSPGKRCPIGPGGRPQKVVPPWPSHATTSAL